MLLIKTSFLNFPLFMTFAGCAARGNRVSHESHVSIQRFVISSFFLLIHLTVQSPSDCNMSALSSPNNSISSSSSSSSSRHSGCNASSSKKPFQRTSHRPKRSLASQVYYGEVEEEEVEEQFPPIDLLDVHDDEKARAKSPAKRRKNASPVKEPKEIKKTAKKKETSAEIETKITAGSLVISGSPMVSPLPVKTKYIEALYTGSRALTDHDLFEMADLEHQHRKLNEAFAELFTPGLENELQNGRLRRIFGDKKAEIEKLNADRRAPYVLLASAKADLDVDRLPELGPSTYPLIRYLNEAPFFELHTLLPEDLTLKVDSDSEQVRTVSPGQVLGFADEETMSLSKMIYEFLLNFQGNQDK